MTKIRIDWEKPEITASGHAGGAPRGANVICAGISAVTFALLNTINQHMDKGNGFDYEIDEEKGYLHITAAPSALMRSRIMNYFEVAYYGLKALEQEYPEEIKIEEVQASGGV